MATMTASASVRGGAFTSGGGGSSSGVRVTRSSAPGLSRTGSTGGSSVSGDALRRQSSAELSSGFASLDTDEDFSRLLASYDVPGAVDALRRYLATEVQSSSLAGGAASKQQSAQIKRKFYERFNQILDRLFGNDDVSKHKYGGWLDYALGVAAAPGSGGLPLPGQRKKRPSSMSTSGAATLGGGGGGNGESGGMALSPEQEDEQRMLGYVESLTASGRALTDFLGFVKEDEAGSMFQFLFKMTHPVEFKLELDLLPEQSKMALMSRSAFTSVLFTQLLQKPVTKQRLDPRQPVLLVSIKELYLFYLMRHPASANHQTSSVTSEATGADAKPRASSLMGSLSDTFARPKRRENYGWRSFYTDGVVSLTRGNPYNVLLLQYLKVFFPDSAKPVQSRFHGKILQHSNLFLHVLIEFWLRQNLIVFSDEAASASAVDVNMYRVQQKLASPFATVLTQTTYMAPSDDLLSSLLLTVIHLLSDSSYPASLEVSASSGTYYSGMVVGSGGGYLSPSISVMRRPLYEFFRLVFSRAPIGLSPTAFFAITDVWLAYIQPWNCQRWAKDRASAQVGSGTRRSTSDATAPNGESDIGASGGAYSPVWETFVLANYHFYTTLLGAFVERAKELDFTGSDERPLVILDRVIGVFNPELLSLLRSASDFLDKNQPYSIATTLSASARSSKQKTADREGLSPAQGQVLSYYCKALGIECIGVPLHASYHRDAERLFDKLWSDSGFSGAENSAVPSRSPRPSSSASSSWFSQPGESAFERVHRLSRQLRRVFEISDAYVASTAHARSLQSAANGLEPMEPSRYTKYPHLLTRAGVAQLRRGLRMCSPEELSYVGDPMLRPICSYEIGALVRLSYRVSTWLNFKLACENPYHGKHFEDNVYVDPASRYTVFRFNLRFLASKPNLVFLSLFMLLLYVLLLW